ncbi:TadE/TadG family type IV pilus assembly protein [Rhizobium sp. CF142]|uniref:TadE/TadG family type IV pilus assembly protein n=1 Tax=Rhizobium sp. CF142 TaxID=1144314 RepID=UPI00026EF909|nr:TadE/TadG family type IV pilus assembly protein [Rhizobium sp. CF142]EJJ24587.1 Flp pilus assembly protein TadG [Rhizobium sp. CF142]
MARRGLMMWLALTARRFVRDREGVGAIEFAIIFPVLIMLYLGAFEITLGLNISKRTTRAAGSIADIITQQQSVTKSSLTDIAKAAPAIFAPYESSGLSLKVTAIQIDGSANPTVLWSWAPSGTAPYAKNSAVSDVPTEMKKANSFLIRTELSTPYTLLVFAPSFLPAETRTITISRSYFYRQRQNDNIPCGDC